MPIITKWRFIWLNKENVTLLVAILTLLSTLYFGLWPSQPVVQKHVADIAYIGDHPEITIRSFTVNLAYIGPILYTFFYTDQSAPYLNIGDVLNFRSITCSVVDIRPDHGRAMLLPVIPRHHIAGCRVIGSA